MFKNDRFLTEKEMSVVLSTYSDEYKEAIKVREVYTLLSKQYNDLKINIVLYSPPVSHMLKTIFRSIPDESISISGTDDITMSFLGTTYRGVGNYGDKPSDIAKRLIPYFAKDLTRLSLSKTIPNGVKTGRELGVKLREAEGFLFTRYSGTKKPEYREVKVIITDDKVYITTKGTFDRYKGRLSPSSTHFLKFEAGDISRDRAEEITDYFFENGVR